MYRPCRLALAAVLVAAYLTTPIALRHGPMAANTNSIAVLAQPHRAGRDVTFDRVPYLARGDRHYLRTYAGEELPLTSRPIPRTTTVSARATFSDDSTLVVHEIHDHAGWPRDTLSYIGLALVALAWLLGLSRPTPGTAPGSRALAG